MAKRMRAMWFVTALIVCAFGFVKSTLSVAAGLGVTAMPTPTPRGLFRQSGGLQP